MTRPGNWWHVAAVALFTAAIVAIGVLLAPSSRADDGVADAWAAEFGPTACDLIAEQPTLRRLSDIMAADMQQSGVSAEQAGEDLATAVWRVCPEHKWLLRLFVMRFGGQRVTA